jgi:hypothetical protein
MTHTNLAIAVATRSVAPARRPSSPRLARLAARLRAGSLDEALIAGADPAASRALAARVELLGARETRGALADAIELLVIRARGPRTLRAPLSDRAAVLANAGELDSVAQLLRGPEALHARGIAIVSQLLTDGTGPLHHAGGSAATARTLAQARRALTGLA